MKKYLAHQNNIWCMMLTVFKVISLNVLSYLHAVLLFEVTFENKINFPLCLFDYMVCT